MALSTAVRDPQASVPSANGRPTEPREQNPNLVTLVARSRSQVSRSQLGRKEDASSEAGSPSALCRRVQSQAGRKLRSKLFHEEGAPVASS
eukprot:9033176-Alexandrium_andersonii.AAC.1